MKMYITSDELDWLDNLVKGSLALTQPEPVPHVKGILTHLRVLNHSLQVRRAKAQASRKQHPSYDRRYT